MPQPLSERTASFTDSVIRRMTRVSLKYGAVNLSQGFPDFDPPQAILDRLAEVLTRPISYEAFFAGAPQLHANRVLIKGSVCGIRVEEIQEPPCGRSAISTS